MCTKCVTGITQIFKLLLRLTEAEFKFLHCKLCKFGEDHSQPCISRLACRNHTEPRITYIYSWTIQKDMYFKLQNKKNCLGVHYSLLVFTQNNLGFVCTVNYVCLNIKKKVPNSEFTKFKTYIAQKTPDNRLTVVNGTFY